MKRSLTKEFKIIQIVLADYLLRANETYAQTNAKDAIAAFNIIKQESEELRAK